MTPDQQQEGLAERLRGERALIVAGRIEGAISVLKVCTDFDRPALIELLEEAVAVLLDQHSNQGEKR